MSVKLEIHCAKALIFSSAVSAPSRLTSKLVNNSFAVRFLIPSSASSVLAPTLILAPCPLMLLVSSSTLFLSSVVSPSTETTGLVPFS